MTTDNPRELRAAALKSAQEIRERHRMIHRALLPNADEEEMWATTAERTSIMARYILATVRDDDGEAQEDVRIVTPIGDEIRVDCSGVTAVDMRGGYPPEMMPLTFFRPTRGQFRSLCRGLGITPAAATAETPG